MTGDSYLQSCTEKEYSLLIRWEPNQLAQRQKINSIN